MRARARSLAGTSAAALRWLIAGTMVATAHGAAVWLAVDWQPRPAAASEPPPAMMIELAPLAVTPDIVPIQSVAAAASAPSEPELPPPDVTEPPPPKVEPPPPEATPPESKPPEPPPPEPAPQPATPPPPAPPEPARTTPEPPPVPAPRLPDLPPEAAKLPDPPKVEPPKIEEPKPEPPKAEQPKPVEAEKPVEAKKPEAVRKPEPVQKAEPAKPKKPERTAARPRSAAAPRSADAKAALSNRSAAPVAGAGMQSVSPASWKSRLLAHLNRYKRFPRGAGAGAASVAFTIDRGGRVLAVRLAGSSGDGRLDGEAMSLLRRASPLPAPPEGFGGGRIALTVPIRFNR